MAGLKSEKRREQGVARLGVMSLNHYTVRVLVFNHYTVRVLVSILYIKFN